MLAGLVLIFVLGCAGCREKTPGPGAVDGVIDLRTWDFERDGIAALKGEWAFYRDRLLVPADFRSASPPAPTGTARLPGLWSEDGLPAKGAATYRLTVRVRPDQPLMALYLASPLSVCALWVNGVPAARSGQPGNRRETEAPGAHELIAHLLNKDDSFDLLLQLSNHHNTQGGLRFPILLGTAAGIHRTVNRRLTSTAILSGSIFILGLSHLGFFLVRRRGTENLYFGIYCLADAVSTAFGDRGMCLAAHLFPDLPWRLSIDLALIPHGLATPLFVMFYHALFPAPHGPRVERAYQILGGLFILYLLVTPPNAFDPVTGIFRMAFLTAVPYLLIRFLVDFKHRAPGIRLLLPGYLILCGAMLNDFLHDIGMIRSALLEPCATIVFVLSYSLLISVRTARAYEAVRELTLEEQKAQLEKLCYQLNPHLLFNALSSIRGAILTDRNAAREMVSSLADLCRLTLAGGARDRQSVAEEMESVRRYLRLEQLRLGDYLRVEVAVEPAAKPAVIPAHLIQPLVENAVKYGAETSPDALCVGIAAKVRGKELCLCVANTGRWVPPGPRVNPGPGGIGLENVRKRLKRLYPETGRFKQDEENGWVRLTLDLPLEKDR